MTFGLVNASFSLPEWQALKMHPVEGQFSLHNCIKPILFLKDIGRCLTGVVWEES